MSINADLEAVIARVTPADAAVIRRAVGLTSSQVRALRLDDRDGFIIQAANNKHSESPATRAKATALASDLKCVSSGTAASLSRPSRASPYIRKASRQTRHRADPKFARRLKNAKWSDPAVMRAPRG